MATSALSIPRSDSLEFLPGIENIRSVRVPVWKRLIDVIGASVGLVVLSPLLTVVAVAIMVESPLGLGDLLRL